MSKIWNLNCVSYSNGICKKLEKTCPYTEYGTNPIEYQKCSIRKAILEKPKKYS